MVGVGERVANVEVWTAPRQRVPLSELVAEGPVLFLFYLFDWSST